MLKLGYDKYVTQGGDWGTWVTRAMGKLYPESVKASHLNMVLSVPPVFSKNPLLALQHRLLPYSEYEQKGLERRRWFSKEGRGYNLLQGSKPQTIAYALNDSPVALLAWIYEKLHDWTDSYPWTDDEILTWISIYWFSRAGPGAAGRIYYEHEHPGASGNPGVKNVVPVIELQTWIPHVKLGFTLNPKELAIVPRTWSLQMGNVVYEAKNDHGGYAAAL
jgi:pimeloyl-ACP methyl ester carboxylesterase